MTSTTEKDRNRHEAADNYAGQVHRSGPWRVIVCRNNLQWIIQHRTGCGTVAGPRWRSVAFCRTRAALVRLWQTETGDDGVALAGLPPMIGRA